MKMALSLFVIKESEGMNRTAFGTVEGREAQLYSFSNANGMEMTVCDYGAHLVSVKVPAGDGSRKDMVLGYDDAAGYVTDPCHLGATIGRNGNRIANAAFELNGVKYQLAANENGNNLHSGPDGYEYRFWEVKEVTDQAITLHLDSPDKDQGFPGNFAVDVTYTLTDDNQVAIHYCGTCDADTVANMTNHSYFNLNGHDSGDVLNHTVCLKAGHFSPVADSKSIPTGEHAPVAGTPMDFTKEKTIGQEIGADFEQLKLTGGYDHNFIIDKTEDGQQLFAIVKGDQTGIVMEAYTDLPAFQFYTGNFIDNVKGKEGAVYTNRTGFCLESQYIPNAINEEKEEKPVLKAGETYDTTTTYKFIF